MITHIIKYKYFQIFPLIFFLRHKDYYKFVINRPKKIEPSYPNSKHILNKQNLKDHFLHITPISLKINNINFNM